MSLALTNDTQPIPGYTIRERIGAGGYGEVWTAEAPGGLEKAIKFVYGYLDEARASREMKALNRIKSVRHPFLLSLERIEVVDGQLLIVTELAEGSLKDRFEQCRNDSLAGIPREELLRYMSDAAEALDFMSERHGLQHLDVKPENLLLSAGRVKVADFGLVKDLQDVNVSMMGGLTPAYAAPEVFNSQPSARSDQYSLAILFQEMLTGSLPFPGRSASQLAAQHLSSRPNVSTLPERDRRVILRGLAKDPQQRFANCREMVAHLAEARTVVAAVPEAASSAASPAEGKSESAAPKSVATQQMTGRANAAPVEIEPPESSPAVRLSDSSSPLHARVAEQLRRELKQSLQASALPPHATTQAAHLRPHLIVSIGGAAALTTKAFLAEMHRRHGDLELLPAIQWLYLDADPRLSREIEEAGYEAPSHDRTLIAHLKRVQDYRAGSQRYLKWLSRRWLYNIPKSQTPESLRPLGRLAIFDKREEICEKLNELIRRATDAAAIAATAAVVGTEFDKKLRVVVVASAAGGVGGGALLDVGDWIREVLASNNICADVQALLLHGTGRQSNRQDLAVANTFATLTEVHDRFRRDWAGVAEQPLPFDEVNLHLLGEHLAPEQWRERTRNAARYLSLLLSPAGARWDQARTSRSASEDLPPVRISSFQATIIGKSSDGLTTALLDSVQAEVIRGWRCGTAAAVQRTTTPGSAGASHQLCIDTANELAQGLRLTADGLPAEIGKLLEKGAGGPLSDKIRDAWQEMLDLEQLDQINDQQLPRAQRIAQELLGIEIEGSREYPNLQCLDERCDGLVWRFLQVRAAAIRELISGLAEQASSGLTGADQAANSLRRTFSEIRSKLTVAHDWQCAEAERLVQVMSAMSMPTPADRKKNEGPPRHELLMQFAATACQRSVLRKALQIVRSLDDVMAELKRNLGSLDRELELLMPAAAAGVSLSTDEPAPEEGKQTQLLRQAAEQLLQQEHHQVAAKIDAELRSQTLNQWGGFSAIVLQGKTLQNKLTEPLRAAVRRQVEQALQQIRLTEIVSLQQQLSAADCPSQTETAELLQCGGKMRWLLMLPAGSPPSTLPKQLAERIKAEPAVDYHSAGEVTLFCLGEEIPLSRAAAHLIGHSPQFVEIASRLLTRSDVDWLPLFVK